MKVAFIGLGTMGFGMSLNILKAGNELTVHNRTSEKEIPVAEQGAKRAKSPKDAAAGAEIIVMCVSDTPDVEETILGENGIIHGASKGSIVVDMSTISPSATRDLAKELGKKGIKMLDAPVSGGPEGAHEGTLAIMVGGDKPDFERALPVLETMGKTVTHVGPIGAGQITKAINQILISGTYLTVAEGLTLGIKAGLDMEKVIQAISGGAAGSWVLHNRGINVVKNEYPLGFRMRLHHKDLGFALDTARELGVTMPATSLVAQIENGLIARGYGDDDVSAIGRTIRELSGVK
ncbi:MAG: NAD(P)-dependent oxidoreductase [Deltaproteobacteria bacterium]|nr:NAD(P)-dependent oxidoreductase [Deltaproteobacteria bacterium]